MKRTMVETNGWNQPLETLIQHPEKKDAWVCRSVWDPAGLVSKGRLEGNLAFGGVSLILRQSYISCANKEVTFTSRFGELYFLAIQGSMKHTLNETSDSTHHSCWGLLWGGNPVKSFSSQLPGSSLMFSASPQIQKGILWGMKWVLKNQTGGANRRFWPFPLPRATHFGIPRVFEPQHKKRVTGSLCCWFISSS